MNGQGIMAYIGPGKGHPSRRQERLSQDARDILAWTFREELPVSQMCPIPMTAVEVKLGPDDVQHILHGGEGFYCHGGSDSLRYFHHSDDEGWALVFAHDCKGDPDRGALLVTGR